MDELTEQARTDQARADRSPDQQDAAFQPLDEAACRALAGATETAVLVLVPEADPVIGDHRLQFDVSASWGVPAHVAVVYPFVPPNQVDQGLLTGLRRVLAGLPAFDCVLDHTAWFGEEVLWLAPADDEPFRRLTEAVVAAFPDHPPYRGAHGADPKPHLSLAERRLGDEAGLRRVEETITGQLPIRSRIGTVSLFAGTREPDSWHVVAEFPLADDPGSASST
ncbi:2'-5' RNA ligase family protein [Modestobacter roseus]|uniref:2'-5' RNA ligase superfamily protein n=1 Tax=Modestobacter roseus TaxID=1181884 RepID=A0A562IN49_9ACTN|nr:2'-5' RNA ligase family protein [Modestobacter roseus]MQA35017.1 2'-5' RNA ligase family protein [Modestobacter roseus]TWH72449.1 2'-5' RNA ligase superfamily protein [Modestobacter roseus]